MQSYNLDNMFAKSLEKVVRLKHTKLKKGSENMKLLIKTKIITISLACYLFLIF